MEQFSHENRHPFTEHTTVRRPFELPYDARNDIVTGMLELESDLNAHYATPTTCELTAKHVSLIRDEHAKPAVYGNIWQSVDQLDINLATHDDQITQAQLTFYASDGHGHVTLQPAAADIWTITPHNSANPTGTATNSQLLGLLARRLPNQAEVTQLMKRIDLSSDAHFTHTLLNTLAISAKERSERTTFVASDPYITMDYTALPVATATLTGNKDTFSYGISLAHSDLQLGEHTASLAYTHTFTIPYSTGAPDAHISMLELQASEQADYAYIAALAHNEDVTLKAGDYFRNALSLLHKDYIDKSRLH